MAKQLKIFVENKPGRLGAVTEILSKKGINIIAFTIQDIGDFGLIKLMVDKPQEAYLALADKGYACALKDVIAISVKDKPGNLYKLSSILMKYKVNIKDAFGFVLPEEKQGVCCLDIETKDLKSIKKILINSGFKILERDDLYQI